MYIALGKSVAKSLARDKGKFRLFLLQLTADVSPLASKSCC